MAGFIHLDSRWQTSTAWGRLSADGRRTRRTAPVNDTWIAASCLAEGLPLATLNAKDYLLFAEQHGLRLVGPAV